MANGNADKEIDSENKLRIQKGFKVKLGLFVEKTKPVLENFNVQKLDFSFEIQKYLLKLQN